MGLEGLPGRDMEGGRDREGQGGREGQGRARYGKAGQGKVSDK